MKLSRFSPLALLLAALLCFAGAYLSNRYGQAPGVLLRTDAARLQQLVLAAETTAEHEAAYVATHAQNGTLSFSTLAASTTYPCFVFRDGQLLYWSDHTTRPDYDNVGQNFREKLVEMQFGRYLALRRAEGRYVVLTYVPLEKSYGISNRYLREGSEIALFRGLNLRLVADGGRADLPKLYSNEGSYLFSLERLQPNPITGKYLPLALVLLGLVLYIAASLRWARQLFQAGRGLAGAAAVVLPLSLLRGGLLYFGLPFSFIELPLFDPRVYAASWLSPSLGDLLINAGLLMVAARYALLLFHRYGAAFWPKRLRSLVVRVGLGTALVAAFFGLLVLLFQFYSNSFNNSQVNFDITQDISLTSFKALLGLAIVLHTGGYLVGFYMLAQVFLAVTRPETRRVGVLGLGLSVAVFLPLGAVLGQVLFVLLGLTLLFFFLVRVSGLRCMTAVPYQGYVFMFFMLGISSAVGALALYAHFDRQLVLNKQTLAGNLLAENDLQGEFLLTERAQEIAADPLLRTVLASPFVNPDVVRQKIVKHYLREYFDKYEVTVMLFDPAGRPVGGNAAAETLPQVRTRLLSAATRTDQLNLFLVRGGNSFSTRRYVKFIPVPTLTTGNSTVLLELTLKKLTAYSVVPELLVDQKFSQPGLGAELSYAGYENDRLVYSEGDFDYVNLLPTRLFRDPRLFHGGLTTDRFHHLAVRDESLQHRTVVVTTATYSFGDWLANFSFLFLLHTFFWLFCLGVYLLGRGEYLAVFRTNFSTKIQLFLNCGILVPLVAVTIATASQVTSSYKRDLRRTYERRGRAVQDHLLQNRTLLADSTARADLLELAENVSSLTETDVNLYDARGHLLVSSQPLMFETGLLGTLMNPQAVAALQERTQPRVLLTERAGTLSFNALYLPLRAAAGPTGQAGAVLGYVGIPFFDSEKDLDNKLIELLSTILSIFTVMFVVFLGLAFAASRVLTNPLKLLTEKLRQTSLTGQNEKLDYQSADEIGVLVRAYNAMLLKLEESKQELAAQEKEAAWREMARQVAHEIKNPLTPMKLSLQYLQKAIAERRPNTEELIGKVSQTLITQIDVLSDIATSFSTFTNLPAMRPQRLDVVPVLRRCVGLHQDSRPDARIRLTLPDGDDEASVIVFADENLLVRTFNNLLINALQAVPEERTPEIEVQLEVLAGARARISIRDNGAGIPEAVRDKVFVPNFTTKATGSGIGLAVARRGIESAGGSVRFETEDGTGTTFYIELPLAA